MGSQNLIRFLGKLTSFTLSSNNSHVACKYGPVNTQVPLCSHSDAERSSTNERIGTLALAENEKTLKCSVFSFLRGCRKSSIMAWREDYVLDTGHITSTGLMTASDSITRHSPTAGPSRHPISRDFGSRQPISSSSASNSAQTVATRVD